MARVLLVEDQPDTRRVMKRALTQGSHSVTEGTNGRDALASVSVQDFDVIVLDLLMPVMDGIAFLEVLRSYIRWTDVPVIVVTAVSDPAKLDRLIGLGVVRTFLKANFHLPDLVAAVGEISKP